MGECVSLCENRRGKLLDEQDDDNFDKIIGKDETKNELGDKIKRTKKNKTRIPKNVILNDDDDEIEIKTSENNSNNQKNTNESKENNNKIEEKTSNDDDFSK
jgi:hypothetical protein